MLKRAMRKLKYIFVKIQNICRSKRMIRKLSKNNAQYGLNHEKRGREIIVSLTSFPARFEQLHLVIRSLLCQTMRPDQIILYYDDDVTDEQFPKSLLDMKQYGLKIEKREGNMKPHKKYYYAMREHADAIVITVDDDLMYPDNLVQTLYETHQRFPECVVSARAHKILFQDDGRVKSYNDWEWMCPEVNTPSMQLIATGCGGVLYPPGCMDERLFNFELIQSLSLRNDDLWLKIMQVLKNTPVVVCDQSIRKKRALVPGSQEESLNASNVHQNINDVYFDNLINYSGLTEKDFTDKNLDMEVNIN